MNIQLSDHFTYKKLLRFTLPSMIMMVFTSIYGVVDGIFVSNFVGKTPFAAINLIMPYLMILGSVGFMVGTGGSALVAKTMGEGRMEKANRQFSMLIYVTIGFGALLTVAGMLLLRPVAILLGADSAMLEDCVTYGMILLPVLIAYMLQNTFQSFLITAEKPHFGLGITIAAGVTNMVLDALFVAVFDWGLEGAAVATAISQLIGGIIPLIYFIRPNSSLLRLGKAEFDGKALLHTCTNGSSELMSNLAMSLVSMLYNFRLIQIAGEDGIAAYGVIMYVNFIFISVFLGFSIGSAPVVSFHYGADNHPELQSLRKKSMRLLILGSILLTLLAEIFAGPLAGIFVSYDAALYEMTRRAFRLYSLSFLFSGLNIFGSSFFTALNNGLISAAISFLRTLVFQVAAVILLPIWLELDGIWLAIVVAEFFSLLLTCYFLIRMRKKYHY